MRKVLIIDKEKSARTLLSDFLERNGLATLQASDGATALTLFKKHRPDSVLLDDAITDMSGLEILGEFLMIEPDVPIIIVTAHGEIPSAVKAIKAGAYDFITKPLDNFTLLSTIKRGIEKLELGRKVQTLKSTVGGSLESLLGRSGSIKKVIEEAARVASSDFSLIIQGETGSGKSILAEIIHNMSHRADEAFVRVDLGAIPETLIESELFGYEKGAFSGAQRNKTGFFCAADKGTIFIDELENTSAVVQTKLLGVAEHKMLYPVGSIKPIAVDVRIISATNIDLKELVKEKMFREDLCFRLGEFIITLPPLRDRVEDIEQLARGFCKLACSELHKPVPELTNATLDLLACYPWPGNVRELKNVIRRAVLVSSDPVIQPTHIDFLMTEAPECLPSKSLLPLEEISSMAVRDAEETAIVRALGLSNGNKTKAASVLKVSYKTLLTKIKKYHIA